MRSKSTGGWFEYLWNGLIGEDDDESVRERRNRLGRRPHSSLDGEYSVWTYDYDDDSSDESSETEGSDLRSEKDSRIDERLFRSEREKQEYLAFKKWKARRGQQGGGGSRLYSEDDDISQMAVESTGTPSDRHLSKDRTEEREVHSSKLKTTGTKFSGKAEPQDPEDSFSQGESKEPDKYVPSSQIKKQAIKPSILKKPKKDQKKVHPPNGSQLDEECSSSVLMQGWLKDTMTSPAVSDTSITRNTNALGKNQSSSTDHCEGEGNISSMEGCRHPREGPIPVSDFGVQMEPEKSHKHVLNQNSNARAKPDNVVPHYNHVQSLDPESRVQMDDWQQYAQYKIKTRDSSVMRISGNTLLDDMSRERVLPIDGIHTQHDHQDPSAWYDMNRERLLPNAGIHTQHNHQDPNTWFGSRTMNLRQYHVLTLDTDKEETTTDWYLERLRLHGHEPVAHLGRTRPEPEYGMAGNIQSPPTYIPKSSSFHAVEQFEGREDEESMFSTASSEYFPYNGGNTEKRNVKSGSPTMSVCSLPPRATNRANSGHSSKNMYGGQSVCSEQQRQRRLPRGNTPVQHRKPQQVQHDCPSVVSLNAFRKRQPRTRWHTTGSVG